MPLPCAVDTAQTQGATWWRCPTCKQPWKKQLSVGLARARLSALEEAASPEEQESGQAEGAGERLWAAIGIMHVLRENGEFEEALELGRETLALMVKTHGNDHPSTITAMGRLGAVHYGMGESEAALGLDEEVLAVSRRVLGREHEDTLIATANLAATYMEVKDYAASTELTKLLDSERRLQIVSAIRRQPNDVMGHCDLVLPLRQEAAVRMWRALETTGSGLVGSNALYYGVQNVDTL